MTGQTQPVAEGLDRRTTAEVITDQRRYAVARRWAIERLIHEHQDEFVEFLAQAEFMMGLRPKETP